MMKHKGTVTLKTDRLVLRRFSVQDAELAFKNWMRDPRVTEFLTWEPHESLDVTKKVLSVWADSYENSSFYQWAIELKDTGEPIGSISVVGIDDMARKAQVGYCIGSTFWGHGYTKEALEAVIEFLFEQVGAERIEAKHALDNPNSGKVMKKCGMKYEGTLRRFVWCNKGIVDVDMYSILSSEWLK